MDDIFRKTSSSGGAEVNLSDGTQFTKSDDIILSKNRFLREPELNDLEVPINFMLFQNYPNPFNPSTQIQYELPYDQKVQITIFDLFGRKVITLINETRPEETHAITWNGKNKSGRTVSSGVYFYKIVTDESTKINKMIMLR